MAALDQLNEYLRKLERRVRFFAASRGAAFTAAVTLALTVLLVAIGNHFSFAAGVVLPLRILLYLSVAAAIALLLAIPLRRLTRRHIAGMIEQRFGDLNERLVTVTERSDPDNPFTELVAEDALRVAQQHSADEITSNGIMAVCAAVGALCVGVLIWMITAAPGTWGYGSALLWTGHVGSQPPYQIVVAPGNKTVRKKSDQAVTARLVGFSADRVTLFAKYRGSLKWEQAAMRSQRNGNGFQFQFTNLAEPVEYYVQAGTAASKHFTLGVRDLPGVTRVKVALHYPSALGLRDVVNDPGGDVRAVQGTDARISVLTDRPLQHGFLVKDDGTKLPLNPDRSAGNWLSAQMQVEKDGSYHVAVLDEGELIRLSDDYFIEARKDEPPVVKIVKPGKDPHVSPIEEVPVTVEASDDFGLKNVELHYSVNGGAEKTVPLLRGANVKQADGKTTLSFENFKVVPGDLVSFYATAKDATHTARTDIFLAKAEPFDYMFRQSQQMGGGGGGAGDDNAKISERQSDIIAATWNELKNGLKDKNSASDDAHFLSDLQGKLGQQAKTLADRMGSRQMSGDGASFESFSKDMNQASAEMGTAATSLKAGKWQEAMTPEQKALQALLRAESTFREIQVAFGQQGGGGGGGGASRDLERMFDLELDTSKNQYETGQSASAADQQQKDFDDAQQRLQALAQRQQELAAQQKQQQEFQQRWEQEMLRREAEQLRQQMQQMAQNQQLNRQQQGGQQSAQQGQQSGQQQSGSQSGQSGSSQSSSARQSASQQAALQQAMQALQRAEDQMRKAVSEHDPAAQREAANQLQRAEDLMNQMQRQQEGGSLADLNTRAQDLDRRQREFESKMRRNYGEGEASPFMNNPRFERGLDYFPRHTSPETDQLANEKEKLAQEAEQIEKQMQREMERMSGGRADDAARLRKALSDAEQSEVTSEMKKSANWIRNGLAPIAAARERDQTESVDQLQRELEQAQTAMKNEGPGGQKNAQNGARNPGQEAQQAVAQLEQLREQLQRQQGQNGQAGNQPGQQAQGRNGQANGQQGQQPGQQGQQGQQGQRGQGQQAGGAQGGGPYGGGSVYGGGDSPYYGYDNLQQTIRTLNQLRDRYGWQDRQFNYDVNYALGYLQRIYQTRDGELSARLDHEMLPNLERLELEISRKATEAGGARTAAAETAPDKYKDAVANYFRKLSQ
jgi:hypothetical protein